MILKSPFCCPTVIKVLGHQRLDSSWVCLSAFGNLDFALMWLWVCVFLCVCGAVCDQVDNSCFCSLCRLVFQDISGRLPQVGFYTLCVRASVHPPRLQWLRAARHYWPSEIELPSLSLLLTHWILTYVELRKGLKKRGRGQDKPQSVSCLCNFAFKGNITSVVNFWVVQEAETGYWLNVLATI